MCAGSVAEEIRLPTFAASRTASLLGLLLGLLLVGAAASATAEEGARPPLTAIEAGPLGRSTLVLLGDLDGVRTVRGMVLAHVRPVRAIKGEVPEQRTVTVLIPGVRPTADRETPSVPYLTEGARGRYVFFLRPGPGGVAWGMEALFDAQGRVGAQKLASLEKIAALLEIVDYEERARETLDWLLEAQRAKGTWTRVNAARELGHLLEVRRDLFDDAVRSRIRKLASRGCAPAQRTWLLRLLKDLGADPPPSATEGAMPEKPGELEQALADVQDADARIRILEQHLHRGGPLAATSVIRRIRREDATVRVWTIRTFAEGGYATHLPTMRGLYAYESDADVRRAIVYATGLLGGDADVTWLEARTRGPSVQREALFALARIRTEAALAALARVRARPRDDMTPGDIPALVDYLQGPLFEEVEAAAGRAVGAARGR